MLKQSDPNKTNKNKKLSRQVFVGVLISITVLIAVHLLLQYINLIVFKEKDGGFFELSNRFDLDDEVSLPTWFSQILLLVIGLGGFLVAKLETVKIKKFIWGTIGFGGLALSADEGSSFHELFLQKVHVGEYKDMAPTASQNAWWIILPLLLFILGVAIFVLFKYINKRTGFLFLSAAIVFIMGAVVTAALASGLDPYSYQAQGFAVAAEEGLEMLGCAIAIYAIIDYIERFHIKSLKSFILNIR